MNKRAVHRKVLEQLQAGLELYAKAARTAHAEATDEQSKAENKYDTRGLEASYLARGQSRHAAETEDAIAQLKAMTLRDFSAADVLDLGALVELLPAGKSRGPRRAEPAWYFIAPKAGGTEVVHAGQEVTVITPQSPLGSRLVGRRQGDPVTLGEGPTTAEYRVGSVF